MARFISDDATVVEEVEVEEAELLQIYQEGDAERDFLLAEESDAAEIKRADEDANKKIKAQAEKQKEVDYFKRDYDKMLKDKQKELAELKT